MSVVPIRVPRQSPWGRIRSHEKTEIDGIIRVYAGQHGGYAVHSSVQPRLSKFARERLGVAEPKDREFLFFENDVAWAVLVIEVEDFMSEFLRHAHETLYRYYHGYYEENPDALKKAHLLGAVLEKSKA